MERLYAIVLRMIPLLLVLSISQELFAGTVHSCRDIDAQKDGKQIKTTTCSIDIPYGKIGDSVEIRNEYNYIVAMGKVVGKKGRFATVVLKEIFKPVRSGYGVTVRNSDSIDYWTATMAPF